ncbi:hypothetical protein BASA83_013507 [Batrachochytrium salamandrivorans]|nr:hypothetical protein BASA83_013507 [Batrachochytrium salamandrivorans]
MLLLQRKVSSRGFGLHVVSFSGSKATFRGRTATARWSSIDHFVCNQAARALNIPVSTANPNLPDGCDSDTVTNRLLDIINPNTAFSSLSNLPLIDTPVPVQHRRLYRATTKKAICRAKNAYRAWLASRSSVLSPQETIQVLTNPLGNHATATPTYPSFIHFIHGFALFTAGIGHALGSMHPRKAPGDDGITTALMQAIAHDPKDHGTGDVNLDRPGALALLRVANTIFLSGVIPKVWRTREESTAQVCALMDILRRRQIADLNSHIAFIDISKAFDTVPIHALFKLRCIGIPTITMNFLSALFHFNARIRSGSLLSDPFQCSVVLDKDVPSQGSYSISSSMMYWMGLLQSRFQASHRSITHVG